MPAPEFPSPSDLDQIFHSKYPALRDSLRFSQAHLDAIRVRLSKALGKPRRESPTVVVCGSLARLEATTESDLDFLIIYPRLPGEAVRKQTREKVNAAIGGVRFKDAKGKTRSFSLPNPEGAFAEDVLDTTLREQLGSKDEHYDQIARRLLILLESAPLWNPRYHERLRDHLVTDYSKEVLADPSKEFVLLINDLIRYFRSLCVHYHSQKEDESEQDKWPLRNVKLRHSRLMMYFSLLLSIGHLSSNTRFGEPDGTAKVDELRQFVRLCPLQRMVRLYRDNNDKNPLQDAWTVRCVPSRHRGSRQQTQTERLGLREQVFSRPVLRPQSQLRRVCR